MNQKIIVFKDYSNTKGELFSAPDGVDIDEAFKAACEAAQLAGETCLSSEIPTKYLELVGIIRAAIQTSYYDDVNVGLTEAEKHGIFHPECRHCDAFEAGTCF